MQIFSLECRNEQRNWLRFALELVGRPYALRESASLEEAAAESNLDAFRLILLPSIEFEKNPELIGELRQRMPAARVLAYGEFQSGDAAIQRRLKESGADIVLDWRVSPTKLAVLLERFFWSADKAREETPAVLADSIRQVVRWVAPSAS